MTTTETKTNGGPKTTTAPAADAKAAFGAKKGEPRPPTRPFTGIEAAKKIRNILDRVQDPEQKKKCVAAVVAWGELT